MLTGLGVGMAAVGAGRARRTGPPLLGLGLAMGLHALWNGSSHFGEYGFYAVYGCVMVPAFALLLGLAVRIRRHRLRAVAAELSVYARAGWLGPAEVPALASMPARSLARALARRSGGRPAARAVSRYAADAAALALLRRHARQTAGPDRDPARDRDFAVRERELLDRLWLRRATAAPVLARAAVLEELLPPWYDPLAGPHTPGRPRPPGSPWPPGRRRPSPGRRHRRHRHRPRSRCRPPGPRRCPPPSAPEDRRLGGRRDSAAAPPD